MNGCERRKCKCWVKDHCADPVEYVDVDGIASCRYRPGSAPAPESAITASPLNVADPIEFGAEEYCCAMRRLDDLGVPREHDGKVLSIVGRINKTVDTLAADAERLDWLASQRAVSLVTDGSIWTDATGNSFKSPFSLACNGTQHAPATTLRGLLDAAMESTAAKPTHATLYVPLYHDSDGNHICALNFIDGSVCPFYKAQRMGAHETCEFAPESRRGLSIVTKRDNGGLGYLQPGRVMSLGVTEESISICSKNRTGVWVFRKQIYLVNTMHNPRPPKPSWVL